MGKMETDKPVRLASLDTLIRPDRGGALAGRGERWSGKSSDYYGMPLIKKAHWGWQIVVYFFLGGIAGGSFLVATLADLFNRKQDRQLVRAGRYLSFVCVLASPVLLILDLGRPLRFHHMLRIFKLRSVMSLGSWGLTMFGMCCGFTAVYQMAQDGLLNRFPLLPRIIKAFPVKIIESMGTFFGLFVASYTGVLLSSTAVPVWARARHILGALFLTSGLSTALASLSLILSFGRGNRYSLERLERAELIAMGTELGLLASVPTLLGSLGKPLFKGKTGTFFTAGTIGSGVVVPLLMRLGWKLTRRPTPRAWNIGASVLVLIGGMILRYVWIEAGRVSADDPHAVHHYNKLEWENEHRQ